MPGPRPVLPDARAATKQPLDAVGSPGRGPAPALLAVALVVALAGCSRQPRFVPAAADSSLAAPHDSFVERVRVLQERWGAAGAGEDAACLTAALLLDDLRVRIVAEPRASWEERARTLLDSLDVGAELASARGALAVNFFSRGDPMAGSWPWLYWRGETALQAQVVEGQGMSLVAVAARGLAGEPPAPPAPPGPAGIAALFARRSGGGQQPLVLAWRAGPRLELAQTLGPDSLGGVGTGAFETPGDSVVVLTTRTWRPTPRFEECATCPHVVHLRRFRWGLEGFERVEDRIVPSPYAAFVRLIQALTAGDRGAALEQVTHPALAGAAQRAGWGAVRGSWRAAPGGGERGDELVFYRGSGEAWRVRFERRGGEWRVDSFEPASRLIE